MTEVEFPRVLVVTSNNFNLLTGGGITLTNLFRGWPPGRIANLHEDPTPEDHTVCRNFYRLSREEIRWAWPFSWAESWRAAPTPAGALSVRDGKEGIWPRLVRRVVVDGAPRTAKITDRLAHWLGAFRPELVYGFLGSMAQIRLTRELVRRLAIPVTIHIMDDWPTVVYERGLLSPFLRRIVLREFQMVLRDARLRLGICEDMCEEYRRRYGYPFFPFHNALDMEQWLPHAKRDWKGGSPFIVRYVGSIVADGQRQGLRDVGEAVLGLRASGRSIELWVHAPKEQVAYLQGDRVPAEGLFLAGPPGPDFVAPLLSAADLLVLPFNFDRRSARYIRLSMPTKVPAYMASGTPILVYGPPGIATVRYAEGEGWGHVVSNKGIAELRKALTRLMDDQEARERLGRRSQFLASQRHDAAMIRPLFQAALAKAAAGGPYRGTARVP